jgi:hypothetical protein
MKKKKNNSIHQRDLTGLFALGKPSSIGQSPKPYTPTPIPQPLNDDSNS